MQYIPGSSVTLSASLHALQHQPLPDDTSVQTRLPQICVDYLSHDWLEEDVWKSWRNMTRHKNEVTNGVRLENASWRTWWKQRNKLRTISPETLNWLKDSDVTWLYGPLHTAADPVPPPRQSTTEERFNLVKASGRKPILKHRTISDLLNIPIDSSVAFPISTGSPALEALGMEFDNSPDDSALNSISGSPRPPMPHTKSESYIQRRNSNRKISPPTLPGSTADPSGGRSNSSSPRQSSPVYLSDSARNNSGGSGTSHGSLAAPQPKKHISFNAFVEQCISIDKNASSDTSSSRFNHSDSDIEEEDTDLDSSSSSILEMKRTASFASGSSISGPSNARGSLSRSNSISSSAHADKVTIAPIAPTVLKTSEELPAPSPAVRFVPPGGVDVTNLDYPSSSPSPVSSTASEDDDDMNSFLDDGFVAPRWGRPAVAPGSVGTGVQGPAGPRDLFEDQGTSTPPPREYESPSTSPYGHLHRHHHHPSGQSSSPKSIGPMAGRSRWVRHVDNSDEDDEDDEDETGADADDSGEDEGAFRRGYRGHRRDEDGSMTASTTSDSTVIENNAERHDSSRRGILKNKEGEPTVPGSSSTPHSHSAPIGIPSTTITHSSTSVVPPQGYNPTFVGGPFASSPQDTSHLSPTLVSSEGTSSSYQQPPSSGFPSSLHQPPSGRGRSSTRTSSSISDRSRSSSKGAGANGGSPLGGSVSPSGYGSPRSTSSRPSRSATDVGLGGGVSAGGRGRSLVAGTRTGSLSPPFVGSNGTGSPAPSLGSGLAKEGEREKEGKVFPPSNLSNSVKTAPPAPQPNGINRRNPNSIVTSSPPPPSSPSTSPSNSTPTSRRPGGSVPASNSATKKATPPSGPRPTVIISHKPSVHIQAATTTGSSTGTGVGSIGDRDRALEEEMLRRQKEAEQGKSDADDTEEVRRREHDRSINPTPSNSPSLGFKMMSKGNSGTSSPANKTPTPPQLNGITSSPLSAGHAPRIQGSPGSGPGKATVSISSASATAGAGVVDKAHDMVINSAKGLLGAIWGGGADGNSGTR